MRANRLGAGAIAVAEVAVQAVEDEAHELPALDVYEQRQDVVGADLAVVSRAVAHDMGKPTFNTPSNFIRPNQ